MEQRKVRDILSGENRGPAACLSRAGLRCLSVPYAFAMRVRRELYRAGILPRRRAAATVICVGNLTTGGTGKTPMVAWVVKHLQQQRRKPAVLTRGYKAVAGVSEEAELIKRLTGAPVVINADRVAGAVEAVRGGADVLVMDDGFQHRRLRRDLDIVLIDATCPFGYGHCLPRGLLREPLSALRSANAIVITRSDRVLPERLEAMRDRLTHLAPQASLHAAVHRPSRVWDGDTELAPGSIAGKKLFAFCGIGSPEGFFATLEDLGATVVGREALDDHAEYTDELLRSIGRAAGQTQATALVTTEKDYVKISDRTMALPLLRLAVEFEVVQGRDELLEQIDRAAGTS